MSTNTSGKAPLEILLVRSGARSGAGDSPAAAIVRDLVTRFEGDPARPFSRPVGISVRAASTSRQLNQLIKRALERAQRLIVVPLVDNDLILSDVDDELRGALGALANRSDEDELRFLPVALTAARISLFPNVQSLLRGQAVSSSATLAVALMQECIAFLRGGAAVAGAAFEVFFSHAKADGLGLALAIKQGVENEWRVRGFFDSRDIAPGSDWRQTLHEYAGRCAMVVVQTDIYSEREWCQKEIIAAKQNDVPILVLNALSKRESRSFPYLGNVPILRIDPLKPDLAEIVTELMSECLRVSVFQARAANMKQVGLRAIAHAPELVTLRADDQNLLYPDPPLSDTERSLIAARTKGKLVTRREMAWKLPSVTANELSIAVSISEPPETDLFDRGLTDVHVDGFWIDLMRSLFMAGISVSYGGDHRAKGFTEQLINLVRAYHREGQLTSKVSNHLSFHLARDLSQDDRVNLLDAMQIKASPLPSDISDNDTDSAYARARAFTQMRQDMAQQTDARIVCGGKLSGFSGRYAGIAEEALIHLTVGKPVYLIGILGGCAQRLTQWTENAAADSNPLSWQGAVSSARTALTDEYQRRGGPQDGAKFSPDEHGERLRQLLNTSANPAAQQWNGLTREENVRLAQTDQADEAIALFFKGLSRRF